MSINWRAVVKLVELRAVFGSSPKYIFCGNFWREYLSLTLNQRHNSHLQPTANCTWTQLQSALATHLHSPQCNSTQRTLQPMRLHSPLSLQVLTRHSACKR
jgi:hypothetical protein